jgi:hypothetical protein
MSNPSEGFDIKAARLQIPVNVHENFENVFKSKYCKADRENNMHISNGTNNQFKLQKSGQNMQNKPLLR